MVHIFIPALRTQRQDDCYKFENNLHCTASFRPAQTHRKTLTQKQRNGLVGLARLNLTGLKCFLYERVMYDFQHPSPLCNPGMYRNTQNNIPIFFKSRLHQGNILFTSIKLLFSATWSHVAQVAPSSLCDMTFNS